MKLPTHERGELQILVIWERKGVWEDFQALRGTRFGDQLSIIPQNALDHALHRLSRPLVDNLGIPPAGALRKLPQAARECEKRLKCPLFKASECQPLSSKTLPWCFEPGGFADEDPAREQAARLIQEWSQGVYVAVIEESDG
jgi:hypothetical protein